MIKLAIVSVLVMLGVAALAGAGSSSTTTTTSGYSSCKHSPETKFMVQVYKQQYPNLSNNQIAHIICDK